MELGQVAKLNVPVVLNRSGAEVIAKTLLIGLSLASATYEIEFPQHFIPIRPFDKLEIEETGERALVQSASFANGGFLL